MIAAVLALCAGSGVVGAVTARSTLHSGEFWLKPVGDSGWVTSDMRLSPSASAFHVSPDMHVLSGYGDWGFRMLPLGRENLVALWRPTLNGRREYLADMRGQLILADDKKVVTEASDPALLFRVVPKT